MWLCKQTRIPVMYWLVVTTFLTVCTHIQIVSNRNQSNNLFTENHIHFFKKPTGHHNIYPEVTMGMNKGQWTKPGICHGSSEKWFDSFHGAERSFNIGSGHCNCQKKTKTVRMKEMFELNSASKDSSMVVNVLGKFCSPDQRAFKRLYARW